MPRNHYLYFVQISKCKHPARRCSQPAGREETLRVTAGTQRAVKRQNIGPLHLAGHKLLRDEPMEVDVRPDPLITAKDSTCRKACGHLLAHLETVGAYRRAERHLHATWACSESDHGRESIHHHSTDGSPPSGMCHTKHTGPSIGHHHRHTVGGIDTDGHSGSTRYESVGILRLKPATAIHDKCIDRMCLAGNNRRRNIIAKETGEPTATLCNMGRGIARISAYIESCVGRARVTADSIISVDSRQGQ